MVSTTTYVIYAIPQHISGAFWRVVETLLPEGSGEGCLKSHFSEAHDCFLLLFSNLCFSIYPSTDPCFLI